MKSKRFPTITVVGPGAIGCTLAGRLIDAGFQVTLVGRSKTWLDGIRRSGLTITRPGAKTKKYPSKSFFQEILPRKNPVDLAILCVKSSDTALACVRIKPLVDANTVVASIQNGLTNAKTLRARFGNKNSVCGITIIAANRINPFQISHEGGDEIFLAPNDTNTDAVKKAAAILSRGGWKVRLAPAEDGLLWTKAAFNACTNPIGALAAKTNGELISIPALRELVFRSLDEAIRGARADKHKILYTPEEMRKVILAKTAPNQPNSMLQDIRAGRKTELDAIVLPILAAAKRRRVATPTLNSLYRFMKRLEKEMIS